MQKSSPVLGCKTFMKCKGALDIRNCTSTRVVDVNCHPISFHFDQLLAFDFNPKVGYDIDNQIIA